MEVLRVSTTTQQTASYKGRVGLVVAYRESLVVLRDQTLSEQGSVGLVSVG